MQVPSVPVINRELLFRSGFGGDTRLVPSVGPYFHGPKEQYEDFVGMDPSIPSASTWESLQDHPVLGDLRIYYEEGNASQRTAQIVPEINDPDKKFLRFQLIEPNVTIHWPTGPERKARVQAELYGNTGLREMYQTVRMRLGTDMQALEQFPTPFHWLTVFEFWNEPFWLHPYPFRISIGIGKPSKDPNEGLYFHVESQKMIEMQKFEVLWSAAPRSFRIPYSTWMNIELYYLEGGEEDGRLYMAVTPDGGERQVIFDIVGRTCHPDNPNPAGLTHYNPMKMYTSATLVEFMQRQGRVMQMDWDDLAFWKGRTPPEHSMPHSSAQRNPRRASPSIIPAGTL